MSEKVTTNPTVWNFHHQWEENDLSDGQVFMEPSCTIPDQSLTIPEIIAKFTRSGLAPASIKMADKGGNIAADPESDPLDDYTAVQAAAAAAKAQKEAAAKDQKEAAAKDQKEAVPAPVQEPEPSAPAPAGA